MIKNGYKIDKETGEYEHRIIYSKAFGFINKGYHVHHIDKDKMNNAVENLIAIPEQFHKHLHELDEQGFVLNNKREVEMAYAFYLKGIESKPTQIEMHHKKEKTDEYKKKKHEERMQMQRKKKTLLRKANTRNCTFPTL